MRGALGGVRQPRRQARARRGREADAAYVIGGLKLTPSRPTFTQARDGILAAVSALDAGDLPPVWAGFAKRGMGRDAVSPPSTSTSLAGVVENFGAGAVKLVLFDLGDTLEHDDVPAARRAGDAGGARRCATRTGSRPFGSAWCRTSTHPERPRGDPGNPAAVLRDPGRVGIRDSVRAGGRARHAVHRGGVRKPDEAIFKAAVEPRAASSFATRSSSPRTAGTCSAARRLGMTRGALPRARPNQRRHHPLPELVPIVRDLVAATRQQVAVLARRSGSGSRRRSRRWPRPARPGPGSATSWSHRQRGRCGGGWSRPPTPPGSPDHPGRRPGRRAAAGAAERLAVPAGAPGRPGARRQGPAPGRALGPGTRARRRTTTTIRCFAVRPAAGEHHRRRSGHLAHAEARAAVPPGSGELVDRLCRRRRSMPTWAQFVAFPTRLSTSPELQGRRRPGPRPAGRLGYQLLDPAGPVGGDTSQNVVAERAGTGPDRAASWWSPRTSTRSTSPAGRPPPPPAPTTTAAAAPACSRSRARSRTATARRPAADPVRRRGAGAVRQPAVCRAAAAGASARGSRAVVNMDMIGTLNTPRRRVLLEGAHGVPAVIDGLAGRRRDVHRPGGADVAEPVQQRPRPVHRRRPPGRAHHRGRRQCQRRRPQRRRHPRQNRLRPGPGNPADERRLRRGRARRQHDDCSVKRGGGGGGGRSPPVPRKVLPCGCREPCHGLCSAPLPPADLAVTVRSPRCVIPRCGLSTRLPAARPCAEPAGAARTIRCSQRLQNPGPPSRRGTSTRGVRAMPGVGGR